MITFTSAQLSAWVALFIWPLARILGLFAAAPVFSNQSIPVTVKICLGVCLTMLVAPLLPPLPSVDVMSMAGGAILVQQCVLGLAMGFVMRLIFAGVELAGESVTMTMGLSFASFYDPMTQGRTAVVTQLLGFLTTLVFLTSNLHLQLLESLVQSFLAMPIGGTSNASSAFGHIAMWAGIVFASGLQLALPIIGALLTTNAALGLLTRAAPQLNIFGVGFPITISVGMLLVGLTLPHLAGPITANLQTGLKEVGRISAPMPDQRK